MRMSHSKVLVADTAKLAAGDQACAEVSKRRILHLSHCVISVHAEVTWPSKPLLLTMGPSTIERPQGHIGLVVGTCRVCFICNEDVGSDAVNYACSHI
jgi:hypothetical protein